MNATWSSVSQLILFIFRNINIQIRDDKKNQLRLRTHIPKEALYKYVGANINRQHLDMLPTTMYVMKDGKVYQPARPHA